VIGAATLDFVRLQFSFSSSGALDSCEYASGGGFGSLAYVQYGVRVRVRRSRAGGAFSGAGHGQVVERMKVFGLIVPDDGAPEVLVHLTATFVRAVAL
jgi:hypothetical protein